MKASILTLTRGKIWWVIASTFLGVLIPDYQTKLEIYRAKEASTPLCLTPDVKRWPKLMHAGYLKLCRRINSIKLGFIKTLNENIYALPQGWRRTWRTSLFFLYFWEVGFLMVNFKKFLSRSHIPLKKSLRLLIAFFGGFFSGNFFFIQKKEPKSFFQSFCWKIWLLFDLFFIQKSLKTNC